jgi:hypothetical protein
MRTVVVRSIPLDQHTHWLDCSECGPLGTYPADDAHDQALLHLVEHGVDI